MRLQSIRIENLRAFCDETMALDDYTCLVGANGSGKSTILTALNIFFGEVTNAATDMLKLDREDFHAGVTDKPVKISLTFVDLSEAAKSDFAAYHRHGKLVISAEAVWNEGTGTAQVIQIGERMGILEFAEFYNANAANAKKDDLERIFKALASNFGIDPKYKSKAAAEQSLRDYEAGNPDKCQPLPAKTEFYGWTGGDYLLNKYFQWVYVPAVKDAASEQNEGKHSCLTRLLERAVAGKLTFDTDLPALRESAWTSYHKIVASNQVHLTGLSESLGKRLQEWAHPDARMKVLFDPNDKAIQVSKPPATIQAGEGMFDGSISRFGHGLQRCFLLAILTEIAATDDVAGPKLLLGIEEPELYQHPPQARHLANVLTSLAKKNCQVVVSTHTPLFVSGRNFEKVRVVRRRPRKHDACVAGVNVAELTSTLNAAYGGAVDQPAAVVAKIHQLLQPSLNEMFFTPVVVLVEGIEDVAYITTYLELSNRMDDFRRLGCHLVPCNKKDQMARPAAVARQLTIPCFVLFDADSDARIDHKPFHKRDNRAIFHVMGYPGHDDLPITTVWKDDLVAWATNLTDVVETDIGKADWNGCRETVRNRYRLHASGDLAKNGILIGFALAEAYGAGKRSASLEKLIDTIIKFASKATGKPEKIMERAAPAPIAAV